MTRASATGMLAWSSVLRPTVIIVSFWTCTPLGAPLGHQFNKFLGLLSVWRRRSWSLTFTTFASLGLILKIWIVWHITICLWGFGTRASRAIGPWGWPGPVSWLRGRPVGGMGGVADCQSSILLYGSSWRQAADVFNDLWVRGDLVNGHWALRIVFFFATYRIVLDQRFHWHVLSPGVQAWLLSLVLVSGLFVFPWLLRLWTLHAIWPVTMMMVPWWYWAMPSVGWHPVLQFIRSDNCRDKEREKPWEYCRQIKHLQRNMIWHMTCLLHHVLNTSM